MFRIAAVFAMTLSAAVANSADLRIETRVFSTDQEEPVCQSVTLFSNDAVYDFREGRPLITIFRAGVAGKPGRFVLLDTEREVRTELTTDKIDGAMANLRRWASKSQDEYLRFASSPTFTESFSEETGELQLLADTLSYRLVTIPVENPKAKIAVRQFLDNFTKLQTLLETSLPPDPRLRVNEALFRHGVIPLETKLYSGHQEEPSLRAEHLTHWMLSKPDRARIDDALDQMARFSEVTNEEFRHGQSLATAE